MRFRYWPVLLLALLFAGCTSRESENRKREESPKLLYYSVNSYRQTLQILENIGYTQERFKEGMKEVPRVLITRISKRWKNDADKIPVETKKSIFLRLMASGALMADEEVLKERRKLLALAAELSKGPISRRDSAWLRNLALKYKVLKDGNDILTRAKLQELIRRVDIVPPSIIVAQGAVESGWGTSRFAVEGNALFGQWSFSDKAMKPKEQRRELGNYGLATFKSPMDSIRSYLLNINTHPAYRAFRHLRSQMRSIGRPLYGLELVHTLEHYSERKGEYIEDLTKVIRANGLSWLDEARLKDGRPVVIHPDG